MSNLDCSKSVRGVFYARMSSLEQEDSIAQQTTWADDACAKEGVQLVGRFRDEGIKGHDTRRRGGFAEMLKFCQEQQRKGEPAHVVVCYHGNRFSRADSLETGWFLWEFRKAGVRRMLTAQRWFDFDKMEDRILLGIEQEATSHKFSVDLAHTSTRGRVAAVKAGKFMGGPPPYGYRMVWTESDTPGRKPEGKLDVDPEAAAVVRKLFMDYARATSRSAP